MKRGFTILELTFAAAITALVAGSLGGTVIGLQRMISQSYSESELSIRMRGLREKLLFHAAPSHDGKVFAGILSGAPKSSRAIEGGNKVYLCASSAKVSTGAAEDQIIELVRDQAANGAGCFKNDGESDPWRTRWLRLEAMGFRQTATARLGYLESDALVDDLLNAAPNRNLYFINLTAKLGPVTHRERLAVPVFAAEQAKNTTSVFHDNLLQ